MDNGFTFDGRHTGEFGVAFIASKWPGSAAVTVNEASVSGRDGTIRYPGETFGEKTLEGTLYILDPDDETMSYTRMMERADEIVPWLQPGGRRRLTLDAMPERFYMAEIKHAIEFTTDEWENGAASLKFTLQPFSYANYADTAACTLAANTEQQITLALRGNRPAPLMATFAASEQISWVQLTIGPKVLRFEGLSLTSGGKLTIDASLDNSEIMTAKIGSTAAMSHITAASSCPFMVQPGANTIRVKASGACSLQVSVRGRWR